jgi:hypothetical protein
MRIKTAFAGIASAWLVVALLCAGLAARAQAQDYPSPVTVQNIANAASGGTTLHALAKLTGAPSTAVKTATTDTGGAIGVVINGAGTSGNAQIVTSGLATCIFDGATTAGDYVQISSTTAGYCHDAGATLPSGQVIGRVLSTNGSAGSYVVSVALAQGLAALATASAQGAVPAWPNNTTTYYRGDGTYAALPLGTNATQGLVEGDGTTLTCASGVCTAIGAAAASIDFSGATSISNGTPGNCGYDKAGKLGGLPCPMGVLSAAQAANVSASSQNTTATCTASSASVTLASAIDFVNGQGIKLDHCGAAFTASAPTGLTVTPTGTTGSTSYQYTIASIDGHGGVGATITAVSTSTGNATLSSTNYNALSWTAGSGAVGYLICGNKSGSLVPLAFSNTTTFNDIGSSGANARFASIPHWVPATCPISSALADWLVTTISSGAGTTSITLATTATTAGSSVFVIHDDTSALQTALNTAQTNNWNFFLNAPAFYISSALALSSAPLQIYGLNQYASSLILESPNQDGFDIGTGTNQESYFHDFSILGNGAHSPAVGGDAIYNSGSFSNVYERMLFDYVFVGLSDGGGVWIARDNYFANCASVCMATVNEGDSTLEGNTFAPTSIPGGGQAYGFEATGDPGGIRGVANKVNGAVNSYGYGMLFIPTTSDGDIALSANSIENFTTTGLYYYNSTVAFGLIQLEGGDILSGNASSIGIYFVTTSPTYAYDVSIVGMSIYTIAYGIDVDTASGINIAHTPIHGSTDGVVIGATTTGCMLGPFTFTGVTTQIVDSSGACTYASITTTKPTYP